MKRTKTLTRSELATRWSCSEKTIRRREILHGLAASGFIGNQPVYSLQDVLAAERRVTEHKRRTLGRRALERAEMPAKGSRSKDAGRIITTAEARRRAGKGGAR